MRRENGEKKEKEKGKHTHRIVPVVLIQKKENKLADRRSYQKTTTTTTAAAVEDERKQKTAKTKQREELAPALPPGTHKHHKRVDRK
jgi:hypothetical protein